MSLMLERVVHRFPKELVLGKERLHRIYSESELHEFKAGEILFLGKPGYGFGIRPVAQVVDYQMQSLHSDRRQGMYVLDVTRDKFPSPPTDYERLRDPETGEIVRETEREEHFKWNIEHFFSRIPEGMTLDEAVRLYDGVEYEGII